MARRINPFGIFPDTLFAVYDNNNGSNRVKFELSGVTGTVVMTVPNASGTIALTNSPDAGYVLKSGDTMTGSLTMASDLVIIDPALINFSSDVGEKISLFGVASYGIGIESNELRIATGGATPGISFVTGGYAGTERVRIASTSMVVNELGNDYDFQVEGTIDGDLIRTDALNNRVGIGTNVPDVKFKVVGEIRSDTAVSVVAIGSSQIESRGTTSGRFRLQDSGAAADIKIIDLVTDGGIFELRIVNDNGTTKLTPLRIGTSGNFVFNEDGSVDSDVRMEGDTDANLFFLDSSSDRVGIGTGTPLEKLHVVGNIRNSALAGSGNRDIYADTNGNLIASSTPSESLTISSGAITISGQGITDVIVDTQGAAATDDLQVINGGVSGQVVVFRQSASARDVTFLDRVGGSDNLLISGDFTPGLSDGTITMVSDGTNWREVSRSVGGTPIMLSGSTTWNPASIAADSAQDVAVTVTGAVAGDPCIAGHTGLATFSSEGILISCHVDATDSARVNIFNSTVGAVDIASGTLSVKVFK